MVLVFAFFRLRRRVGRQKSETTQLQAAGVGVDTQTAANPTPAYDVVAIPKAEKSVSVPLQQFKDGLDVFISYQVCSKKIDAD